MEATEDPHADDDPYADIEFEVLDEAGVREAVDNALALAGCSWLELQAQAKNGCIRDPVAHRVWIAVSSLLEPSDVAIPNVETVEALQQAESGEGLTEYQSVDSRGSDVGPLT